MTLAFIDFEEAFDSILPRAKTQALTSQGDEKPLVERQLNLESQFVKILQNIQLPKATNKRSDIRMPFTVTLEKYIP